MEKVIKPSEYAISLGVSRQAIYAKIKKGVLQSKSIDGKLYVVLDNMAENAMNTTVNTTVPKDHDSLLAAKDETIAVLKETMIDLKESNHQISTTLKGEIDLLKEAFHEMRTLYANQIEQHNGLTMGIKEDIEDTNETIEDAIEVAINDEEVEVEIDERSQQISADISWMSLKKFFKKYEIASKKKQNKIRKRLKKAYKSGDDRLSKIEGKIKIDKNKNYKDIINKCKI